MGNADPTLDHQGLEVLDPATCWDLVARTPVGRIAFVEGGEPMVLPVNHAVVGHRVVFRTFGGSLLHEALLREPVAFEVDDFDRAARNGWSVTVTGQARQVVDPVELERLSLLGLEPYASGRDNFVVVPVQLVTGRRVGAGPLSLAH